MTRFLPFPHRWWETLQSRLVLFHKSPPCIEAVVVSDVASLLESNTLDAREEGEETRECPPSCLIWPIVRQSCECRCSTRQDHQHLQARILRYHECQELERPITPIAVLGVKFIKLFVDFRVETRSEWYHRRCHVRLKGLDALHQDIDLFERCRGPSTVFFASLNGKGASRNRVFYCSPSVTNL